MKIRFACSPSGGDALHRAYAETTVRRALRPVGATVQLMEICLDAEAGRARLRASCPPASAVEIERRRPTWAEALEDAANALAVELQRTPARGDEEERSAA